MLRSLDTRVHPYFDEQEYEVNNSKMHCDTCPDTYQLYERRVLTSSFFNQDICQEQRLFRRCSRHRNALQANMSTIATSRETTPTLAQQEEIAYGLLQRAQLQSTAVN